MHHFNVVGGPEKVLEMILDHMRTYLSDTEFDGMLDTTKITYSRQGNDKERQIATLTLRSTPQLMETDTANLQQQVRNASYSLLRALDYAIDKMK